MKPGAILVRQRGTKYHPIWEGKTVGLGKDHTIFAKQEGKVVFVWNAKRRRTFLGVAPLESENQSLANIFPVEPNKRSPSWDTF